MGATNTGISIHKILDSMGIPHFLVDTREEINFDVTHSKFLISLKLGMDNTLQAIEDADELYFSPGFNRSRLKVDESKIKSELNLFLENSRNFLIGVTGTNGKSTVCYLISQLLDSLNIPNKIIGNFGEPMLGSIHFQDSRLVLIVELSSFQLKDSSYDNISKDSGLDIGIFTNFSEDHLDNHLSIDDYLESKRTIEKKIRKKGVFIYHKDILETHPIRSKNAFSVGLNSTDYHYEVLGLETQFKFGDNLLASISRKLSRINMDNTMFALAAVNIAIAEKNITYTKPINLNFLQFLKYRMEIVRSDHLLIVNDSKSTNPDSTYAALDEFINVHEILILILGGDLKGLEFNESRLALNNHSICYIYGKDAPLIYSKLSHNQKILKSSIFEVLDDIHSKNLNKATILFSPGCSSKDQFDDYLHRGQSFNQYLKKLGLIS